MSRPTFILPDGFTVDDLPEGFEVCYADGTFGGPACSAAERASGLRSSDTESRTGVLRQADSAKVSSPLGESVVAVLAKQERKRKPASLRSAPPRGAAEGSKRNRAAPLVKQAALLPTPLPVPRKSSKLMPQEDAAGPPTYFAEGRFGFTNRPPRELSPGNAAAQAAGTQNGEPSSSRAATGAGRESQEPAERESQELKKEREQLFSRVFFAPSPRTQSEGKANGSSAQQTDSLAPPNGRRAQKSSAAPKSAPGRRAAQAGEVLGRTGYTAEFCAASGPFEFFERIEALSSECHRAAEPTLVPALVVAKLALVSNGPENDGVERFPSAFDAKEVRGEHEPAKPSAGGRRQRAHDFAADALPFLLEDDGAPRSLTCWGQDEKGCRACRADLEFFAGMGAARAAAFRPLLETYVAWASEDPLASCTPLAGRARRWLRLLEP